jgi:alpha-ribazole phosphatase
VRHLRPPAGEGRCYGRTELAPPPFLSPSLPPILLRAGAADRIVASPLRRCRALARILGSRLRLPVRLDPDWREIDFGRWEGLPWDEVPRPELDAWAADLMHARPHGGESVAMLLARVRRALRRLAPGGRTLVVTHAGPIRAALVATGAGEGAWRRQIRFGEVVTIAGPRTGRP